MGRAVSVGGDVSVAWATATVTLGEAPAIGVGEGLTATAGEVGVRAASVAGEVVSPRTLQLDINTSTIVITNKTIQKQFRFFI